MKIYKVITPAGNLYTESYKEAKEYKDIYGYPFVVIDESNEDEMLHNKKKDGTDNKNRRKNS